MNGKHCLLPNRSDDGYDERVKHKLENYAKKGGNMVKERNDRMWIVKGTNTYVPVLDLWKELSHFKQIRLAEF